MSYSSITVITKLTMEIGRENPYVYCLSCTPVKSKLFTDSVINHKVHQICKEAVLHDLMAQLTFYSFYAATLNDNYLMKIMMDLQNNSSIESMCTTGNNISFKGLSVFLIFHVYADFGSPGYSPILSRCNQSEPAWSSTHLLEVYR